MYEQPDNESELSLVRSDVVPRADKKTKSHHFVKKDDKWFRFIPEKTESGGVKVKKIQHEATRKGRIKFLEQKIEQIQSKIGKLKKRVKEQKMFVKHQERLAEENVDEIADDPKGAYHEGEYGAWLGTIILIETYKIKIEQNQAKIKEAQQKKEELKQEKEVLEQEQE